MQGKLGLRLERQARSKPQIDGPERSAPGLSMMLVLTGRGGRRLAPGRLGRLDRTGVGWKADRFEPVKLTFWRQTTGPSSASKLILESCALPKIRWPTAVYLAS